MDMDDISVEVIVDDVDELVRCAFFGSQDGIKKHGEVYPMLIIEASDGIIPICVGPLMQPNTKDAVADIMVMMAASGAKAILMVCESWRWIGTPEDLKQVMEPLWLAGKDMSDAPEHLRTEDVQVTYFTQSQSKFYYNNICRESGAPKLTRWMLIDGGSESTGRFGANPFDAHQQIVPSNMATIDSLSGMLREYVKSQGITATETKVEHDKTETGD